MKRVEAGVIDGGTGKGNLWRELAKGYKQQQCAQA